MKRALVLLFLAVVLQASARSGQSAGRERLSLNMGWRFYEGDVPFPDIKGHQMSYRNAKAGVSWGAASPKFDDNHWSVVDLPHDWAIGQARDREANLSQAYRKRGIGWYRRSFKLPESDRGKHLEVQFEGIATACTIWFNGILIKRNWSGYNSISLDITALSNYGEELNSLSIRVDAVTQEGWWYEGAGIYRNTWLLKRAPVHIATDGVLANPVKTPSGTWSVPAGITLNNSGKSAETVTVSVDVLDPARKLVASAQSIATVSPLEEKTAQLRLSVSKPSLWSPDRPTLYQVITRVKKNGRTIDSLVTSCGFRTLRFDAARGFFINDLPLKIKGVCNHQDHAGLGVALPRAIWEFRLRKLKEMGANAYRCAHNAPPVEMLDLCDELGILVMDENRNFNVSDDAIEQLRWMVKRDRNHPSVILWSVFNEEPMQGTENGYEMVRRMTAEVKKLDRTRPVTAAMNGGLFTSVNVAKAVDVVGFNYQTNSYDKFHAANPGVALISTEDSDCYMIRGEFKTDRAAHLLDSYDTQRASWGNTHRDGWKMINERPWMAGGFAWTGFDYHGEPAPFEWPTSSSNSGILDLCGFPKSAFYIRQALWLDSPVIHLAAPWNGESAAKGSNVKVMAISNADSVKLWLNGRLIGTQPANRYDMNAWTVPYEPGRLEAAGYKNGREVSRTSLQTPGAPAKLELIPDRSSLNGDGWDAMPVTVRAVDENGVFVPTARLAVEFQLTGEGSIIGLGNGDPNSLEPEKGNRQNLFNGLAQVIIRADSLSSGNLQLTARAGAISQSVLIPLTRKATVPFVPPTKALLQLESWRVSPVSTTMPEPGQKLADDDMNSWLPVKPGELQELGNNAYAIYRSTVTLYRSQQEKGARLTLKNLAGTTRVYIGTELVGTKTTEAPGDLVLTIPPKTGELVLNLVIGSGSKTKAGLGGVVTIE